MCLQNCCVVCSSQARKSPAYQWWRIKQVCKSYSFPHGNTNYLMFMIYSCCGSAVCRNDYFFITLLFCVSTCKHKARSDKWNTIFFSYIRIASCKKSWYFTYTCILPVCWIWQHWKSLLWNLANICQYNILHLIIIILLFVSLCALQYNYDCNSLHLFMTAH